MWHGLKGWVHDQAASYPSGEWRVEALKSCREIIQRRSRSRCYSTWCYHQLFQQQTSKYRSSLAIGVAILTSCTGHSIGVKVLTPAWLYPAGELALSQLKVVAYCSHCPYMWMSRNFGTQTFFFRIPWSLHIRWSQGSQINFERVPLFPRNLQSSGSRLIRRGNNPGDGSVAILRTREIQRLWVYMPIHCGLYP